MYLLTSDEKVVPCTLDSGNDLLFVRKVDWPADNYLDFLSIVDRDGEIYDIEDWTVQRETRRCIVLCVISDFFLDEEEDDETASDSDEPYSDYEDEEAYFPYSDESCSAEEDSESEYGYPADDSPSTQHELTM